jgi:prepilin-type N-terminal cleavage/methylation domain-containing protein
VSKIPSGLTLIELIFVIAVIAVLGSMGILFYQHRMQDQKIEQTAQQMGQWLQAGMAYYVRNKKWPTGTDILITQGYMPITAAGRNPWCQESNCYTLAPSPDSEHLLRVTAKINAEPAIRTALAARLPYGESNHAEQTVIGIVNVPMEGNSHIPEMVLISVLPYQLVGSDFILDAAVTGTFITKTDNKMGVCLKVKGTARCADVIPKCAALFGGSYKFESHAIVSGYHADQKGKDNPRQPIFSVLGVTSRAEDSHIFIMASVRPQIYWRASGVSSAIVEHNEKFAALKDSINIQGQVFLFCKRI